MIKLCDLAVRGGGEVRLEKAGHRGITWRDLSPFLILPLPPSASWFLGVSSLPSLMRSPHAILNWGQLTPD